MYSVRELQKQGLISEDRVIVRGNSAGKCILNIFLHLILNLSKEDLVFFAPCVHYREFIKEEYHLTALVISNA